MSQHGYHIATKIIDTIKDWCSDIYYWFYSGYDRFMIIYKWIPIIWKDNNWDYAFIYDVLEHKLKETARYIEQKKRFVEWEFVVRDIRICVKLIDLVRGGYYEVEYMDFIDEDIQFLESSKKDFYEVNATIHSETLDLYFSRNKSMHRKALKYIEQNISRYSSLSALNDKRLIAHEISRLKHEKAQKLLFRIMEEKIQCWWD